LKNYILNFLLFFILVSSSLAETKATIDPLDIGVGTRALGMGKAYVAAADDINSIFLNPAGLSLAKNWGATSMYSSLISEVTYNTFGAYRVSSMEGYGIGFVSASLGGDIYTSYRDPASQRIVPLDVYAAGYTSNVFLLSYGTLLGKYFSYPVIERTSLGFNFKAFYQQLNSTDESYAASGYDLDLGIIYPLYDWLKVGLYGQNVLPVSAGGVLRWDEGAEEEIPANYKLGVNAKLLGEGAPWQYPQDVFLNFDLEDSFIQDRPSVYHLGIEWWLYNYLAFRAGVDQDVYAKGGSSGIDNNTTFGLGFWYGDLGFDYAYHQYGPLSENLTHYFSLSYGYPKATPPPKPEVKAEKPKEIFAEEYIRIKDLTDKSIIYKDSMDINGEILKEEVEKVEINGNEPATLKADIKEKAIFSLTLFIQKFGKFPVSIKCFDKDGKLLKEYKIRILRIASFSAVPPEYWAKEPIEALASLGIIGGFPDGTFRPDKTIDRAELATLLVRATGVEVPPVKDKVFKDVGSGHWAAKYIKVGVERGIVLGYRDQTFRPTNSLNRAEGLMMIARFAGLRGPEIMRENPFPDLSTSHWAAKMVFAAKEEGILSYLAGKSFEPDKALTRAEAAEMLSRTKFSSDKIKELKDWEVGFE